MIGTTFQNWIVKARAVKIEDEIARRNIELTGNGAERVGPCPICNTGTDRFSINTRKQKWNCRQCKKKSDKGDVIGLVQWLDDCDFMTACTTLNNGESPPKANRKDRTSKPREIVIAEFVYQNEDGSAAFAVERIEYQNSDGTFVLKKDGKHKKIFRQKRPNPDHPGKWIKQVLDDDGNLLVRIIPYRLPQVIAAIAADQPILVVEGEAKANLLSSWNVAATCNAGGAKKWKPEHAAFLKDADVVLVPDHDNIGWQHVHLVGASLVGIAKRIRVLVLPNLPTKGDVIDWARPGGTREQLDQLIAQAPAWEPAAEKLDALDNLDNQDKDRAEQSEAELLDALAKMPKGIARGRERKRLAKQLGVNASDIDAEIEARQAEAETTALLHGHWYVEPWPEPVDGDALIRDIIRKLRKHVVISFEGALSIALWIILAWVHDEAAIHSPILTVTSAEPESGKSTTLAILSFLVPRAIATVDISRGALYRAIKRWQPSFVIDEFDDVLAAKADGDKGELRSVINSGHARNQGVLRCVSDDHTPELFPTFAPKAIGMVGRRLPATTASRCIPIELSRAKRGEQDTKFTHQDDSDLADLRSRLLRWSLDNVEKLRSVAPSMPDTFDNRRVDNWHLQFAIADLCSGGEDWGDKARLAAIKIEGGSDSRTVTALLLAAIKIVFDNTEDDAVGSQELCDTLAADQGSEWAEWGKSRKPITQAQLSAQGPRGAAGPWLPAFVVRGCVGEVPLMSFLPPP
jgi:hypothetical protein